MLKVENFILEKNKEQSADKISPGIEAATSTPGALLLLSLYISFLHKPEDHPVRPRCARWYEGHPVAWFYLLIQALGRPVDKNYFNFVKGDFQLFS